MTDKQKLDILLASAGIPKSVKFEKTSKHLVIVWNGDQSVNGTTIVNLLHSNGINYLDPRANTTDVLFKVEPATNTTVRTVMTMDKLTKRQYDKILDTAEDEDGDGVKELEPASDEEEDLADQERQTESEKHVE